MRHHHRPPLPVTNRSPLPMTRRHEVHGNWRVTFRFEDGDAEIVDYEDYH